MIQDVIKALDALGSPDKNLQKEANSFLETFQSRVSFSLFSNKQPEAWHVAMSLIQSDHAMDKKLFGAQTLRQKCQFDLSQLDHPAQVNFKDTLVSMVQQPEILSYTPIVTQICLCLADIAIQLVAWTNPTIEMINVLHASPRVLLDFLSFLPEEIMSNYHIPIEREALITRSDVLLAETSDRVFELLMSFLGNQKDIVIQEKVLKCLAKWLHSGDIKITKVQGTNLIPLVFASLANEELFEVAVDLICELIACSGGELNRAETHADTITQIYNGLLALVPCINECYDDSDRMRGLCRIFCEAGESYKALVLDNFAAFKGIVDAILACASFHDLEIVKITFNFWYYIAEELVSAPTKRTEWIETFTQLLHVMVKHLHYPDEAQSWSSAERDEFREFRHEMGDVLKDCVRIVGEEAALVVPYQILHGFATPDGKIRPQTKWQEIEAPLFALRTMGSQISKKESKMMPEIMSILPHLPDHPKVKYAAILVIGRYAEWTNQHQNFLEYQLTYISKGFEEAEATGAAASALKYLCESCGPLLVDYLPQLHPFYHRIIDQIDAGEANDVTQGIAEVINYVPLDRIVQVLDGFAMPLGPLFADILSKGHPSNEEEEVARVKRIKVLLGRLQIFLQFVRPNGVPSDAEHPCISMFKQLLAVIEPLLDVYGHLTPVSEAFARCIRSAIDSYSAHFAPLLSPVLNKILPLYEKSGDSAFLWIARNCIKEFAFDSSPNGQSLYRFAEEMTRVTYKQFESKDVFSIPDVVEDFFGMLKTLVEQSPNTMAQSPMIPSTIDCALACMKIEKSEPLEALLLFLVELFKLPRVISPELRPAFVDGILHSEKWSLVINALMDGCLHTFPRGRGTFELVGEIFVVWLKTWETPNGSIRQAILHQTQAIVASLGQVVTQTESDTFLSKFSLALGEFDVRSIARCLLDFSSNYRRRCFAFARNASKA